MTIVVNCGKFRKDMSEKLFQNVYLYVFNGINNNTCIIVFTQNQIIYECMPFSCFM